MGVLGTSAWWSNRQLRRLALARRAPRRATAGRPAVLRYQVENQGRRLATFALDFSETGLNGSAFLASLPAQSSATVELRTDFPRRGIHSLEESRVSTSFPFGLYRKLRVFRQPDEVVVWPPTDRPVREVRPAVGGIRGTLAAPVGSAGARGDFHALRSYRPGDDPRDIHWRSTARAGELVVREYQRDAGQALWLCLDTRQEEGPRAEAAVEITAALAFRALRRGERVALAAPEHGVEPGTGQAQLERILDALAKVVFRPGGAPISPPVDRSACILVTASDDLHLGFGDVFTAPDSST